jgi:hypothetical protein
MLPARSSIVSMTALLAVLAVPAPSAAQGTFTAGTPSPYEASKIAAALAKLHATIEPHPEGKIVEGIDIVPLEVIEDGDPAPGFLNVFHTTTRITTLRREVLVEPGEPYRQYRIDETVRSLRTFQQLSLVLAVATRGSTGDRVRVLLVTKDVWSLRAGFDLKLGAGGLDLLRLEPTERNIGGTFVSAIGRFELYPNTLTLGGAYIVPRIANQRMYLITDGNVVLNRDDGHAEGSYGRVGVSSPQLSADMPFVWGVGTQWQNVYMRRYVGAKLATFDAAATPEDDAVPDVVHARSITTTAAVVRSFGVAHKVDLTLGGELNVRELAGLDPDRYDARVVAEHRLKRVPTSDQRAGPWVQARAYESRFLRLHDADQLGLQEDYRVGYDTWLRAYPITRAIGSTRDFLGVQSAAQYVLPLWTGYARATAEAIAELQPDAVPQLAMAADVALVSPTFGIGRLVIDAVGIARPRNYLNQRTSLGGEGRLRGYPSAAFLGENLVAYNVELRSRPVEILSCQVGTALFFDIGDAFDGAAIKPKSSTGFGFRGLFPQLDRKVFRIDIAFPLVRAGTSGPVGFYVAFEQAFPSSVVIPPSSGAAQSILNPLGGALGQ